MTYFDGKEIHFDSHDMREINKAFYKVLTCRYKKDAPDAFKKIDALPGLDVYKANGYFSIRNMLNGVYIDGYNEDIWGHGYLIVGKKRYDLEKAKQVDFYNFLYKNRYDKFVSPCSESRTKYEKLAWKKKLVNYEEEDIVKTKKEIEKLQQKLEHHIIRKAEKIAELNEYRKQIGLEV